MIRAFDDDKKAIKEGKPALSKLRMISNVSKELMKYHYFFFTVFESILLAQFCLFLTMCISTAKLIKEISSSLEFVMLSQNGLLQ